MPDGKLTSRHGVDADLRAVASLGAGITAGTWLASTARQFGNDGMSAYLMLAEGVAEAGAVTAFFLVAFGISGRTRQTGLAVKLAAAGSLIVAASWLRPPVASASMSSVTEPLAGAAAGLLLGGVIAFCRAPSYRAPLSSSLVAAGLVGAWFLPPAAGWAMAAIGALTALVLMTVRGDAGRQPPPITARMDRLGPEPPRIAALVAAVIVVVTTWLAYDLAPNWSGSPRLSEYLIFALAISATAVAVPLLLAVALFRLAGWASIAWAAVATGAVWLNLHALPHVAGAADGPRIGRWIVVLAGVAVGLALASRRSVERHARRIVASGLILGGVLLALDNALGISLIFNSLAVWPTAR